MILGRLLRERGTVMVLVAAAMFPMVGMLTFAIDVSHWFDYSRNLQNRADAAALAGGDAFGNVCFAKSGPPGDVWTGKQSEIGKWAQLYSGPGLNPPLPAGWNARDATTSQAAPKVGPATDNVPYPDSGPNSVMSATGATFQNSGNTNGRDPTMYFNTASDTLGSLSQYFVLLNANNYYDASGGGSNFAMGTSCSSDPHLDLTDKNPGPAGAMVDVKVTQSKLSNFIPIFGSTGPNINAHSRVEVQGLGEATHLRPLGVRDPGATPCARVTFVQTNGSDANSPTTQTVILTENKALEVPSGPEIWDNSSHNGGNGDSIKIPNGANLYMQSVLYAQGASKDCTPPGKNALIYGSTSGILYLDGFGTAAPGATGAPVLIGSGSVGGVTLVNNTCAPDQYFNGGASCSVTVCAIAAFTPLSSQQKLQVNGANMTQGNVAGTCDASGITGATAWTKTVNTTAAPSGQDQFDISWSETSPTKLTTPGATCPGKNPPFNCSGDFGVEQQAFAACDEITNAGCTGDPNNSGAITHAVISEPGVGSTIGSFRGGTSHNLIVRLDLSGLQDAQSTDRCPNQCTVLRFGPGNSDGSVDCGGGNSTSNSRNTFYYGCPLAGQAFCTNAPYCGGWIQSGDGSCNNATRTNATAVDCVGSNNNGTTIPECVGALVATGGTLGTNGDICNISNETGCSEDHWLTDGVIKNGDPRIIDTFIMFPGDLLYASGNTDLPIRNFAAFYVTGWNTQGNGHNVSCPNSGPDRNESGPSGNSKTSIWGHWISYVTPGNGNGQPCDFSKAFGLCVPVLTR